MDSTVSPQPEIKRLNRREFLYYLGGASLLLFAGEVGIGLSKFLNPYGQGTGIFKVDMNHIPEVGGTPKYFAEGYYWLVHTSAGLIALDAWCTTRHEWLIKWVGTNRRYECPVCGAKFQIDGTVIEWPETRSLDRYTIEVMTDNSTITTPLDGSPVSLEGARQVVINSIGRIPGKPRL